MLAGAACVFWRSGSVAGDWALRLGCCASFAEPSTIGRVNGSARNTSASTHASPADPIQEASISPIGDFRDRCSSRPKKYATAENSPTVLGEQTTHLPATSSSGFEDIFRAILKRRICGKSASVISLVAS